MPPARYAALLTAVIAAAGATVALAAAAGLPPAGSGVAALAGAAIVGLRRWRR